MTISRRLFLKIVLIQASYFKDNTKSFVHALINFASFD